MWGDRSTGSSLVLLGGVESLIGPLIGAAAFTLLQDTAGRSFDYWRAATGAVMLVVVLAFPQGLAGLLRSIRWRAKA
jgi:branched-chain amino acid transport system permease protein